MTNFGVGVAEVLFREASVGVVTAIALTDGRRVVVKVHQPRENQQRLQAVHDIQAQLYRSGFPCPEPLIDPIAVRNGHATAEALLDLGEFKDTHNPTCRQLIAEALAWHLQITASGNPPPALAGGWTLFAPDRLWPTHAHAPIFDFQATAAGAEWIDTLAAEAKAAIDNAGTLIAGHSDWSGKHFRFAHDRITAVYDWDSLAVRTEAAIVGVAAMTYTTRLTSPAFGAHRPPTSDSVS